MKRFLPGLVALFVWSNIISQDLPEFSLNKEEIEIQLRFLASDALEGRNTASTGAKIAASYIAQHLKAYGYKPPAGQDNYFQKIPFENATPPKKAFFTLNDTTYEQGGDLALFRGKATKGNFEGVFAKYGWIDESGTYDDYQGIDVKGKIVFVLPGTPESSDVRTAFNTVVKKRKIAAEKGAVGLIVLYQIQFPWKYFVRALGRSNLSINKGEDKSAILYGWINDPLKSIASALKEKTQIQVDTDGMQIEKTPDQNVIGILPGSDPILSKEYILLSAHYDHVGVASNTKNSVDSIFNGARDNGMGVVALLSAAKALAQNPPKRSVIILAVTGEELGLLGSNYYAENPLIPLNQTIYNLNTDGAGYNDKSAISVIGHGRTGTDVQLEKGAAAFGLKVIANPAPEQGLFDRSDNASFAKKGVPALNVSPGATGFDEEIIKYYHQLEDEADSVDFDYLLKYCKTYAHIARLIANMPKRPFWVAGDKYEEKGKALYYQNQKP